MMENHDLDALVATTPENNLYVSDFWSISQWTLRGTPVFTVLPRDAEPAIISPISDLDLYAEKPSWIKDVQCYGTFYIKSPQARRLMKSEERLARLLKEAKTEATPVDALVKVLKERSLEDKTLGVDEAGTTCIIWEELRNKLPAAQIKHGASIFKEIRMVKTSEEVKRLKRAAEISEKALGVSLEEVKEGVSETDLAHKFEVTVTEEGGRPFITVFGCGTRSAFPNAMPSRYKLKKGDIVRFDGGCVYQNYLSDIAFSAVFGESTEKHEKYYTALDRGTKEAIDNIKPGVKASDLFSIALETTRKAGIPRYMRHHCGHGIGIEVYDMPLLRPTDNTLLEEGMTLNVETPYYEIGFGGLQVEETIVVTSKGCKYLTTPTEKLLVL
jgi:Xaa-Pro aminopeptidase